MLLQPIDGLIGFNNMFYLGRKESLCIIFNKKTSNLPHLCVNDVRLTTRDGTVLFFSSGKRMLVSINGPM
jgi:hypothetical protein